MHYVSRELEGKHIEREGQKRSELVRHLFNLCYTMMT